MRICRSTRMWIVRCGMILFWIIFFVVAGLFVRADFFAPKNTITILSWSGTIDGALLKKFEAESGIRVFLNSYSTNEELLVKLRATGGRGYDLVVPSDYAVEKLIKERLAKKIDLSKLDFIHEINPVLMGLYFDPKNEYSIPFGWDIFCLGINTLYTDSSLIKNVWQTLFDGDRSKHRIIMTNDPLEAMLFSVESAKYDQNGTVCSGGCDALYKDVLARLRKQRKNLEAYTTVRADYLLGMGHADIAIMQTTDLWRAMRTFMTVDFIVPSPTFITVENCVIPAASTKEEEVYRFLNFLFKKENAIRQFEFCPTPPARLDVLDNVELSDRQKSLMRSSPEQFKSYLFIRDPFPEFVRYDLWVATKS